MQSEATRSRARMLLRGGLVTSQTCLLWDPAPPGFLCMRGQVQQYSWCSTSQLFNMLLLHDYFVSVSQYSMAVGLFLARGENYYMSKVILGCLVPFVYREGHACLCPQNNLETNSARLCCSLFPSLFFLSALLAQIFCLQEICPRATFSITFSYFSWLPASNMLPTANLLSSAFATHSIRMGFSSQYSFMPCIM